MAVASGLASLYPWRDEVPAQESYELAASGNALT